MSATAARVASSADSASRNRPSTVAFWLPDRTLPASARAPDSSRRLVTIIVLPAPVSPVNTVNPGLNCAEA
ncbi:Uncharacterised protein [Mycobacteroides abscessus subsp. abscessus]|nr:Uncharacterised protein [Mycobacteroides abscessus subsp. abscessus]